MSKKWFTNITDVLNDIHTEKGVDYFTRRELAWLRNNINPEVIPQDNSTRRYGLVYHTTTTLGQNSQYRPRQLSETFVPGDCYMVACLLCATPQSGTRHRGRRPTVPRTVSSPLPVYIQITKFLDEWYTVAIESDNNLTLSDGITKTDSPVVGSHLSQEIVVEEIARYICDGFGGLKKLLTLMHIQDHSNNKKYPIIRNEQ